MHTKNYLERLHFALVIQSHTRDDQIPPKVTVGFDDTPKHTIQLTHESTPVTVFLTDTVYEIGEHKLFLQIDEQGSDSYKIGTVRLLDVRLHGFTLTTANLNNCVYRPVYDDAYLHQNPEAPRIIDSCFTLGNRGRWELPIQTPVHDHGNWKGVGLV